MSNQTTAREEHPIVSKAEWLEARRRLLAREKELSALRDQLSAARRQLPWTRVEQHYSFETSTGPRSLSDLFDGRSQLLIYHFMFAPESAVGCKSCSFWADNFDGIAPHLEQRDVSFLAVSRAPLPKLQAFAKRLGWSFPWVSSNGSSFNADFGVSFTPAELASGEIAYNYGRQRAHGPEMPGISVFFRDDKGAVFHTYSCYARGLDMLNGAYHYLDLVPKGRDEAELPYTMAWLRLRDEYGGDRA